MNYTHFLFDAVINIVPQYASQEPAARQGEVDCQVIGGASRLEGDQLQVCAVKVKAVREGFIAGIYHREASMLYVSKKRQRGL